MTTFLALGLGFLYCYRILNSVIKYPNPAVFQIATLLGFYILFSIPFMILAIEWINEHIRCIVACLGGILITLMIFFIFKSANKEPIAILVLLFLSLIIVLPLVPLISTACLGISTFLNSQGTWGGTAFIGAKLTDANFSHAFLPQTNFKNAHLENTCFYQAQKLNPTVFYRTMLSRKKALEAAVNTPLEIS